MPAMRDQQRPVPRRTRSGRRVTVTATRRPAGQVGGSHRQARRERREVVGPVAEITEQELAQGVEVPAPVRELLGGGERAGGQEQVATTMAPASWAAQRPSSRRRPVGSSATWNPAITRAVSSVYANASRAQIGGDGDGDQLEQPRRAWPLAATVPRPRAPTTTPIGSPNRMAPCWRSAPSGCSSPYTSTVTATAIVVAGHQPGHAGDPERHEGADEHQRREQPLDQAQRAVADRDDRGTLPRGSRSSPPRTARCTSTNIASPARIWLAGPR